MNGSGAYSAQSRNLSEASGSNDSRRPGPGPPAPSHSSSPAASRAERFEDEKRRMIESCFSKVDVNGQLSESYITHIRITEDAAHPSTPPPPDSASGNKKPRVVIIAVRSSGRVRMHKARENTNGTFSIGKTWNLEDLSAIESFNHPDPSAPPQRERSRQWAGPVGFLVTISKPYYWQAGTAKEKDFFIASLVKIFRKYTKGQIPEMKGFSPSELEAILGLAPGQQPPQRPPIDSRTAAAAGAAPAPPRPPFAERTRTASNDSRDPRQRAMSKDRHRPSPDSIDPAVRRQMSQDPVGRQVSQEPVNRQIAQDPASRQRFTPDVPQQQDSKEQPRQPRQFGSKDQGLRQVPSRERLVQPSQEQLRAPPSRDVMRPPPNLFATGRSPGPPGARVTPQSSHSELRPQHSELPPISTGSNSSRGGTPLAQQPLQAPPQHTLPLHSMERQRSNQSLQKPNAVSQSPMSDGPAMFSATIDRWKPQTVPQNDLSSQRQRPHQIDEPPPTRPLQLREQAPPEQTGRNFSYEVQALPERKRPPMSARDYSTNSAIQKPAELEPVNLRPPPLSTSRTPSTNSVPQSPVTREAQQPERIPGAFYETPTGSTSTLPLTTQPKQEQAQPVSDSAHDAFDKPDDTPARVEAQPPTPLAERPQPAERSHTAEQPQSAERSQTAERPQSADTDTESDEMHRPGLGPMFKKKAAKGEVAKNLFRAATAYNAFKPRAGGAGERLAKEADTNGPDGINAVVPAPLREISVDTDRVEPPASPTKTAETPPAVPEVSASTPDIEVTSPMASPNPEEEAQDEKIGVQLNDEPAPKLTLPQPEQELELAPAPEPRRPKRRSAHQDNYLRSLDIDPRLLDGRGLEFETILTDFGWGANVLKGRQLEDLEADLKRELGRIEAGSWLGHLEQKDDRVEVVDSMLDRAIAECDELEGLLTLYAVELGSLNDDIAFIEAQSQGLQVQTANQKILHAELQKLVETISISPRQLQPLRHGDLTTPQGLTEVERSLLLLYKAMVTIDPSMRSAALSSMDPSRPSRGLESTDVGTMQALREKRQEYLQECTGFCQRLLRHLDSTFDVTLSRAKPALMRSHNGIGASVMKLNASAYNLARDNLWQFSPLLLFTKEVNQVAWQTSLRSYYTRARPMYSEVFRENAHAWKKSVRKTPSDSTEILFSSVEKESPEGGLSNTARRITVKRSQTLAKTFRAASAEKVNSLDARQVGRLMPCEVFAGVLEEQVPMLGMEQNFIVELFHATSLENIDFADAVMAAAPAARNGQDLSTRRLMEPDRKVARQVTDVMEEVFGFWSGEMRTLMEWAVAEDPIQGVGIITSLAVQASQLQETSQEYALHNLNTLSSGLAKLFTRFVDEQVKSINVTKVKITKRKGVISFMKIFPPFSAAVENVYHETAGNADSTLAVLPARQIIDEAYVRINKTMWDCLKSIATESRSTVIPGQAVDPDKQALNHLILIIENMHHYIEEVDDGGREGSALAEWKARALMDRAEALEEYVGKVVSRPLGKILAYVDTAESLLAQGMSGPSIAATRPTLSRHKVKRDLKDHLKAADIRTGIDALRKRIEKHFGEGDEEQLARQLVALVYKECERRYEQILDKLHRVSKELYKDDEKQLQIEWTKEDVRAAFKP